VTPDAQGPAADRLSRGAPRPWRQAARALLLAAIPRRWLTASNPAADAPILLTFDDGPDPELTPRVLDLLSAQGVRAAFFVIGQRAQQHPDLIRRIDREGHLIGNHSWSHPAAGSMSTSDYLADVRRGRGQLEQLLGRPVKLFRPPHGHLTAGTLVRLWLDGTQVMLWNTDPKDYVATDPAAVSAHLRGAQLRPGDIVLLHDTIASTVAALPEILAATTATPASA
jgi:peptidoglycan/xylan/chitin deacetylase (PgdA/CDA1 family)